VDGAALLDGLAQTIAEFVIMGTEEAWAVALWIVFTHAFDAAAVAPKLWIKSAEKRSGKSRLLELLAILVRRALVASYMTPAVIFRLIEARKPTLLLDEFDTFIHGDERLRGLLDAGFDKAHSSIWICVGDDREPTEFSVWAPMAFAGIGSIPDTVADRSIRIELERKARERKVARLRRRDTEPLVELAQKAARWAADNLEALVRAEPEMPQELNDRAADAWEMLIAFADVAGGHWPERARLAALKISGDADFADAESVSVQLLHDIRAVFEQQLAPKDDREGQVISSQDLVNKLGEMEDRPWPEFMRGRPITQHQLARVLRKFHVSSGSVRLSPTQTARGYKRKAFEPTFLRYLPPLPEKPEPPPKGTSSQNEACTLDLSDTTSQAAENQGSEPDFEATQGGSCVGSKTPENPSASAACDVVSAKSQANCSSKEEGSKDGSVAERQREMAAPIGAGKSRRDHRDNGQRRAPIDPPAEGEQLSPPNETSSPRPRGDHGRDSSQEGEEVAQGPVTQPNGSAADDGCHAVTDVGSSAGRRLTPIETDILLYADEHPDLPVSKIAKAFGTTKARVVKVLGRDR
jgi:Protein of unknown function (DUF3631)